MNYLHIFSVNVATIFGTCHKLEPLSPEAKSMWRREMDCFLSICDFILDPSPTEQTMPGGHANEVRKSAPISKFLKLTKDMVL